MADEFNFLWSQIQNYIAEADADLSAVPGQIKLHGRCRCGVLLSPCFGAVFVADLLVGMEESELHSRCRGRFTFRKIRIETIAVRMVHNSELLHRSVLRHPMYYGQKPSLSGEMPVKPRKTKSLCDSKPKHPSVLKIQWSLRPHCFYRRSFSVSVTICCNFSIQESPQQNQTKASDVRELSGRSPELVPEPPLACKGYTEPLKGGSGTSSGLLPGKFANLTCFGLVCRGDS